MRLAASTHFKFQARGVIILSCISHSSSAGERANDFVFAADPENSVFLGDQDRVT
jgi:hypothetical protein